MMNIYKDNDNKNKFIEMLILLSFLLNDAVERWLYDNYSYKDDDFKMMIQKIKLMMMMMRKEDL